VAPRCEIDVFEEQLIEHVLRSEAVELHRLYFFELQRHNGVLDEPEPTARRPRLDREDVNVELQARDSIGALPESRRRPSTSASWKEGHWTNRSTTASALITSIAASSRT
jgi:hypothetical protein